MIVSGTEKDILITIARLGKASKNEIGKAIGFNMGYIELICNYLIRKGCIVRFKRYYMLTEGGENVLFSLEGKRHLKDHIVDKEFMNITTQVAEQIAKKVIAEMDAKGIRKEIITKSTRIYPRKKKIYPKEENGYPEKRREIQIKTDFDLPVEDESLALESNIDKVGIEAHKEKSNIDKAVNLLKNIYKKNKEEKQ